MSSQSKVKKLIKKQSKSSYSEQESVETTESRTRPAKIIDDKFSDAYHEDVFTISENKKG